MAILTARSLVYASLLAGIMAEIMDIDPINEELVIKHFYYYY